jgi:hypothetical protein
MMPRLLQSNLSKEGGIYESTISVWTGGCNKESRKLVHIKDDSIGLGGCMLLVSQLLLRGRVEIPLFTFVKLCITVCKRLIR